MNFTKVIFRPVKRLKLIGSWVPERTANFYSVLSRENSTLTITIFCIFRFEVIARGLDDVSRSLITTSNGNLLQQGAQKCDLL